jgi:hypothetical protein
MLKMKNTLLFLLILGLISCDKSKLNKDLAQELRESPETIALGNNRLVLTTYLWRDFMPIAEENGSPLACVNNLTDVDSNAISSAIHLKKQYVIHGNEIWEADYMNSTNETEFILQGFVNGGPKWGPDIQVDVVCEFEYLGNIYRILAKSQHIEATW